MTDEPEFDSGPTEVRDLLKLMLGAEGRVVSITPLGMGASADSYRAVLEGAGWPSSAVVKVPARDAAAARTAASLGLYEREAWFYEHLAARLEIDVPTLYEVLEIDGSRSGLVMEDLSGVTQVPDQLRDAALPTVRRAMSNLSRLQAPFWDHATMADDPHLHRRLGISIPHIVDRMQSSWATSRERLSTGLSAQQLAVIDRFVENGGDWAESLTGPFSLTHHDYRLDNMLLTETRTIVVDWQTVGWGPPMFDVAYLLATSWSPEQRRTHEQELIARHADELVALGVSWRYDEAWEAYRHASFATLLMLVPPTGSVKQSQRADAMYRRLLSFGAQQVLDLGTLGLIE